MHICCVILSLEAGGAERVMANLANHWAGKDHKVSLVILSNIKPFYSLDPKIELIQINGEKSNFWLIKQIGILQRILKLRKTIKKLKPDVIISFIDLMNIATLIASYKLEIPVVISERIDPAHHPIPLFYKWLRLKVYPLAYKLVVQTKSTASYFPKRFKKFISIIPNAVPKPVKNMDCCTPFHGARNDKIRHCECSEAIQKTSILKRSRYIPQNLKEYQEKSLKKIITVGRLDKQKDHKTLIMAFANVIKKYSNLELTIYGEGKERKNLEFLIKNFRLQDKVMLPGTTNNITNKLAQADLFIFPSIYEGFPNALSEAMAIGLPVIASRCSGNIDIVQDKVNGRLFPIGNVESLTDIILELIIDLEQRKKLSQNAKLITEQFSVERVFADWDKLISNLPVHVRNNS